MVPPPPAELTVKTEEVFRRLMPEVPGFQQHRQSARLASWRRALIDIMPRKSVIWRNQMKRTPRAPKAQRWRTIGRELPSPERKAAMSVTDVTVMLVPATAIVLPRFSSDVRCGSFLRSCELEWHSTKASSMPRPSSKKASSWTTVE